MYTSNTRKTRRSRESLFKKREDSAERDRVVRFADSEGKWNRKEALKRPRESSYLKSDKWISVKSANKKRVVDKNKRYLDEALTAR